MSTSTTIALERATANRKQKIPRQEKYVPEIPIPDETGVVGANVRDCECCGATAWLGSDYASRLRGGRQIQFRARQGSTRRTISGKPADGPSFAQSLMGVADGAPAPIRHVTFQVRLGWPFRVSVVREGDREVLDLWPLELGPLKRGPLTTIDVWLCPACYDESSAIGWEKWADEWRFGQSVSEYLAESADGRSATGAAIEALGNLGHNPGDYGPADPGESMALAESPLPELPPDERLKRLLYIIGKFGT